jgi:hypothetical protein
MMLQLNQLPNDELSFKLRKEFEKAVYGSLS